MPGLPEDDDILQICPFCGEDLAAGLPKCPHCGEFLSENSSLLLELRGVEVDAELADQLREWPESNLLDALENYIDDYRPAQQKAIVLEIDRRVVGEKRRGHGSRSETFSSSGMRPLHRNAACGVILMLPGLVGGVVALQLTTASPMACAFSAPFLILGAIIVWRAIRYDPDQDDPIP